MKTYDEVVNLVNELVKNYNSNVIVDTQEWLSCNEGINGKYVYNNIPLEILVRIHIKNEWEWHNDSIKTIVFFLMHFWNIEDISIRFGNAAVDKLI